MRTTRPAERLFRRLGTSGALVPSAGDYIGLTTQNWSGNKIDLFLNRSLRYDVHVDPSTGEEPRRRRSRSRTMRRPPANPTTSFASPEPTRPDGHQPHRRQLLHLSHLAHRHGAGPAGRVDRPDQRGLNVYTTILTIPSGETANLQLQLRGSARLVTTDGDPGGAPHCRPPGDAQPRPCPRPRHCRRRLVARPATTTRCDEHGHHDLGRAARAADHCCERRSHAELGLRRATRPRASPCADRVVTGAGRVRAHQNGAAAVAAAPLTMIRCRWVRRQVTRGNGASSR